MMGRSVRAQLQRLRLNFVPESVFDRSEPLLRALADGQGWTIATPLCLVESGVDPKLINVQAILEPMNARQVSFLVRPHELGKFNLEIAQIIIDIARECIPNQLLAYGSCTHDAVEFYQDASGKAAQSR